MEEFLNKEGLQQALEGVKEYVDSTDRQIKGRLINVEENKVDKTQIASREQAGLSRLWEDSEHVFHIWTMNPDVVNTVITENPEGGETYDIRTLNYRIEPNTSGGETYIFGEGGPGPGPVEDTYYAMGSFNEWQGTGYPMSETDIEYIRGRDVNIAQSIENIEGGYENIYYIDGVTLGDFDAGWTNTFGYNNQKYMANGSLVFDFCFNADFQNSRWIPTQGDAPNPAALYNLSPNTLLTMPYQPTPDEWGKSWNDPPVCIGGAGVYTLILVKAVEDTNIPGYNPIPTYYAGLIKTENIESEWGNIEPYDSTIYDVSIIGSMTDWNSDLFFTPNTNTHYTLTENFYTDNEFVIRTNSSWDNGANTNNGEANITYYLENFPSDPSAYIERDTATTPFRIVQDFSMTITIDMPTADEDGFLHSAITFTYGTPVPPASPEFLNFRTDNEGESFSITYYNRQRDAVETPRWDGTVEYSYDGENWIQWDGSTISSSPNSEEPGEHIYMRGTNNTTFCCANSNFSNAGRLFFETSAQNFQGIRVIGNLETLLDWQTVLEGGHPSMQIGAFDRLFYVLGTPALLKQGPTLGFVEVSQYGYRRMYAGQANLETLSALPATVVGPDAYRQMYDGCHNIEIYETPDTGRVEYSLPTVGQMSTSSTSFNDMFNGTGGDYTGSGTPNTTYYTTNTIV